jgi:hypothetical protein
MGPSAGAINLVGGTDQGHGLIDRANFSPFKMANRRPARFTERAQRPPFITSSTARSVKRALPSLAQSRVLARFSTRSVF